jgi:acyl-CoA synthetase (NDP forming)
MDLSRLFHFSSVAFIGASDSSNFGTGPFRTLNEIGFKGEYYPVNPRRDVVHGRKAYKSLEEIPGPVDVAIMAVARDNVLPSLEACAAKGVGAAVVMSAGFAEAGPEGAALQERVAAFGRAHNLLIVGPNCMGAVSVRNGCAIYQGRGLNNSRPGNVAVVSQSGGLMNESIHYGNARGVGFSHLISTGNEAIITAADALSYFIDDPDTKVVLAIIETMRQPKLFLEAAARAKRLRKPIVMLKMGTSEKGARSALSHTGAMTGDNEVWNAVCRQTGVVRVRDIDELVDMALLLSYAAPILGRRTLERAGVIEISGGATELICDLAETHGVALPDPSPSTRDILEPVTQGHLSISNPLDTGILWISQEMATLYPVALKAFATQPDIDVVVSRYIVPPVGDIGPLRERLGDLRQARQEHEDRLFVVLSPTSDRYSSEWAEAIKEFEFPFLQGLNRGLSALGKLAHYSRALADTPTTENDRDFDDGAANSILAGIPDNVGIVNEVVAKNIIRARGIPVVPTVAARTAAEAAEAAEVFGYPVAVKFLSPQLTHKSDLGGVRLGVTGASEVEKAFRDLENIVRSQPGADFEGVSVQPMAEPGIEVVLGAHRDPQFGPVIMFGLGGIFVEILKDVTLRLAPLTVGEAEKMLDDVRAAAVLKGARNRPPAPRAAIADALCRLSALMMSEPRIISVDINPAIATAAGLTVVDARVILDEQNRDNRGDA